MDRFSNKIAMKLSLESRPSSNPVSIGDESVDEFAPTETSPLGSETEEQIIYEPPSEDELKYLSHRDFGIKYYMDSLRIDMHDLGQKMMLSDFPEMLEVIEGMKAELTALGELVKNKVESQST